MKKYLWYTDTHLDRVLPWTKYSFYNHLKKENPAGIFLTGDISGGILTTLDLRLLASQVSVPIYFVLGNHDYHFNSFEMMHNKIRSLSIKYPNLIWLTESDVIGLTNEVALIGAEGWYDASIGKPKYLKATSDWILTKDFRKLKSMEERIAYFQFLADESCRIISDKLQRALDQNYETVYILTHFPPWKEATRDEGTFMEKYWLPYNVNLRLGQTIEKIMTNRKKGNVIVLSGHTHCPEYIRVRKNVECQVGSAKLFCINSQKIFI